MIAPHHLWQSFTQMKTYFKRGMLNIDQADGVFLREKNGKSYVDASSSLWNVHLGHRDRSIRDAIVAQLDQLDFATLFGAGNTAAIEFAAALADICPAPLEYVFPTSNGSDAIETAIKMARQYHNQEGPTGRTGIICLDRAYHGVSYGGMSAGGWEDNQRKFAPLVPGFSHLPAPYCYRCPAGRQAGNCGLWCAETFAREVEERGAGTIAAFLLEPVMGVGGVLVPPPGYLRRVADIARENGILLILDEVATGFCRTGTMFAFERTGVVPDILVLGKGISSGYLPLGAVVASEQVYERFWSDQRGHAFLHGYTNGGHPVCCAAGTAAIRHYRESGIAGQVEEKGAHLRKELEKLRDGSGLIGDIRGTGLMFGIELVENRAARTALREDAMGFFMKALYLARVWADCDGHILYIMPPLVSSPEEIGLIIDGLSKALRLTEERYRSRFQPTLANTGPDIPLTDSQ